MVWRSSSAWGGIFVFRFSLLYKSSRTLPCSVMDLLASSLTLRRLGALSGLTTAAPASKTIVSPAPRTATTAYLCLSGDHSDFSDATALGSLYCRPVSSEVGCGHVALPDFDQRVSSGLIGHSVSKGAPCGKIHLWCGLFWSFLKLDGRVSDCSLDLPPSGNTPFAPCPSRNLNGA